MSLSIESVVRLIHLVALALGVGAATAKNVLLLKCTRDHAFVQTFLKVEKPITGQIIAGQAYVFWDLTATGVFYAIIILWTVMV